MSDYQIKCTVQSNWAADGHGHILQVGIADAQYSVWDIYGFMDNGHKFYALSKSTGKTAWVEKARCCGRDTLRTVADGIVDNNLDALPHC